MERGRQHSTVLLASKATPKSEAVMQGLRIATPLEGVMNHLRGRKFILEEEQKDGTVKKTTRRFGLERFHLLPGNVVTIVTQKAPSNVAEQPQVDRLAGLTEGYQGAKNRMDAAIDANAARGNPRQWDLAVGIENALITMDVPGVGEDYQDMGFIYMKANSGEVGIASSAGTHFGTKSDMLQMHHESIDESERTVPVGHLFSPENPQDPHWKQSRRRLHRSEILAQAVALAHADIQNQKHGYIQ